MIIQLLSRFHKIYIIQAYCYCFNPNVVALGVSRKNPRQKVPEESSPEVRHVSECIKSPVQSLHHRTL